MSALHGEGNVGPADERPLTDQEYRLLQRLLSDPLSLPTQFKTWLVSYLETSDLNLPISAINGLTSILGIAGVGGGVLGILPAGMVFPYGGASAPAGSLLCDGAAYIRSTYPRLFAAIGSTFGAPDASSFNVPDLRERIPVGKGVHVDHDAVGKSDGLAVGQRRVKHAHQAKGFSNIGVSAGSDFNVLLDEGGEEQGVHDHHPTDGQPYPVGGPAYITLNFIIVS